jgi:hypothetical protein
MNDNELIYTKESIEFATVAKEFLAFLESASKMTKEDFIDTS